MQHIVSIFFLLFSLFCIVAAVLHEVQWWRRKDWLITSGTVVRLVDERSEIEFVFNGQARRFISNYGGEAVEGKSAAIGTSVRVTYDPITGDAEELTWSNRWLMTIVVLFLSLLFAWAGIATW